MKRRYIPVMLIMLLTLAVLSSFSAEVGAQDGLSVDEIALIDRVVTAASEVEDANAYRFEKSDNSTIRIIISVGEEEIKLNQSTIVTAEGYILNDGPTKNALLSGHIVNNESGTDGNFSYVLTADIRIVNDKYYISALFDETSEDFEPLPEGFQGYATPEEIPIIFGDLSLDALPNEIADSNLDLTDRGLLLSIIETASVEEVELDDGTVVEVMHFQFTGEALMQYLSADADPMTVSFLSLLIGADSEFESALMVTITPDGNLIRNELNVGITLEDYDISLIDSASFPPNTLISMSIRSKSLTQRSDFDGEFDPIEVPANN